jgi:hypothetical protein
MSKQANRGRKGAVRQKAVKAADLANMERHGKREDESGQRRRVRETAPLVYGSLDIRDACAAHLDGVQRSRGAKTECLHALVQYPTKLIDGADEEKQQWMLDHAVAFVNDYHGGDAVFAARLDRDEKGRHSVDVFAMPRYDYAYKDGRTVKKASVSKFSKEHARERFHKLDKAGKPILDKKGQKIPRDDRRAQGSALQDAWFEYMRDQMGLDVLPPERKKATAKDRVEPEVYGLRQDQARFEKARQQFLGSAENLIEQLDQGEDDLAAERAAWEAERDRQARELRQEREALAVERRSAQAVAGQAQKALESVGRVKEAQSLAKSAAARSVAPVRKQQRGRDGPALD